jgi:outer membrane protein assembly factor BamB
MPGIDTKGTPDPSDDVIYSDISGNDIVAIDSGGNQLWRFNVASDIDSTPTVGPDSRVYFGTDLGRSLFAIDPDARAASLPFPQAGEWRFLTGGEVNTVPALSPDASVVYFVSNDDNLYAVNTADGSFRWQFPILTEPNEINSSPTVNPNDGTVYVGADDNNVYALNPAARTAGLPFPQASEWAFATGGEIESSPAIDPVDGTIYIGSDDQNVYAIRPNGTAKPAPWPFFTNGNVESSPIVDLDRTIYIGSNSGRFFAINPNGTQKWNFLTGDGIPSSPAFGLDGFIRIGSDDFNLYTLSQYADPRNFKDADQNLGKLLTSEDLDSSVVVDNTTNWLNGANSRGSWAVRLEVDRCPSGILNALGECEPNADGKFDYELRLWMRQCFDQDDTPCSKILGTFYQDTRIEYDYTAVEDLPMRQQISLSGAEQDAFESFFFGFTGAAGAEVLNATISQFQLSFIRPGDPVVTDDSANWLP